MSFRAPKGDWGGVSSKLRVCTKLAHPQLWMGPPEKICSRNISARFTIFFRGGDEQSLSPSLSPKRHRSICNVPPILGIRRPTEITQQANKHNTALKRRLRGTGILPVQGSTSSFYGCAF